MKEAPLKTFERQHHMHPILGTNVFDELNKLYGENFIKYKKGKVN